MDMHDGPTDPTDHTTASAAASGTTEAADGGTVELSPWWGWWHSLPDGARVAVSRTSSRGLTMGAPVAQITAADAMAMGLDDEPKARAWLASHAGGGSFRWCARDADGGALRGRGITSLAMELPTLPGQAPAAPAKAAPGADHAAAAVELRRLELEHQAREAAAERAARLEEGRIRLALAQQEAERDEARHRREQEAQARREQIERERAERAELLAAIREASRPQQGGDVAALVQAQMQAQASAFQQMLAMTSQISQGLIRQAVDTATASTERPGIAEELVKALPHVPAILAGFRSVQAPAAPAPTAGAPAPAPAAPGTSRMRAVLHLLRSIQTGETADDDDAAALAADMLPDHLAAALTANDQAAVLAAIQPALDSALTEWIADPAAQAWLAGWLPRLQAALAAGG